MVEADFGRFALKLCSYWERKAPAKETLALWFEQLHFIPQMALPWITEKFNDRETWPRNFCAEIKSLWYKWLSNHPEHKAREQEVGCPDCHAGWITVCYIGYGEQVYHTAKKCASCNRHGHPREAPPWYLDQVIDAGKYYRPIAFAAQDYYTRLPELPGYDYSITTPQANTVEGLVAQTADRVGIC